MADHRPDDERDDAQYAANEMDANGMSYYMESGSEQYVYEENDPQRFYIDGYDQENNPEDDDFDDDFDEDFIKLPDEDLSDPADAPEEGNDSEETVDPDEIANSEEDDEFDDLNADENVYGGEDD